MLKTPWAPALRLLCRARHKPLLAAFKRLLLLPALAPALSPPARHPWTHPQPSGHPLLTLPRLQTRAGPAALALWSLWTCARPRTRSITWTRRSTGGARSRWVPAAWSDAAHGERGGGPGGTAGVMAGWVLVWLPAVCCQLSLSADARFGGCMFTYGAQKAPPRGREAWLGCHLGRHCTARCSRCCPAPPPRRPTAAGAEVLRVSQDATGHAGPGAHFRP